MVLSLRLISSPNWSSFGQTWNSFTESPVTHRVTDQWSVLMVTSRTCWLTGCPTIIPKNGLLESSLFSFRIILLIIQGSSVHRIQSCLGSEALPNELMSTIESEDDLFAVFEDTAETEDITLQSCDTDNIESRTAQIKVRHEASIAQQEQAERMVKRSRVDLQAGIIGDNVAVPIPAVDRGRGDARNISGVVVNKTDNDHDKIAVKCGLLTALLKKSVWFMPSTYLGFGWRMCGQLSFSTWSCVKRVCIWRSRLRQVQLRWFQAL